jgi:hypothetical protein
MRTEIEDVPCISCQRGYSGPHWCALPSYCPCDRSDLHPDSPNLQRARADAWQEGSVHGAAHLANLQHANPYRTPRNEESES